MKIPSLLLAIIFASASSVFAQSAPAKRSTAQVTVRANLKSSRPDTKRDDNDKDKKDKGPKAEVAIKALELELSGAKSITGPLKLVATFYARDAATKDPVVEKKFEKEVTLDASRLGKVTTDEVSFTLVPAHTKKVNGRQEKIDASGHTYYGWVVRVFQGDVLEGEAASAPPLLALPQAP